MDKILTPSRLLEYGARDPFNALDHGLKAGPVSWDPEAKHDSQNLARIAVEARVLLSGEYAPYRPQGPRSVGYALLERGIDRTDGRTWLEYLKGQSKDPYMGEVSKALAKARRAGYIPWDWISDGRTKEWSSGPVGTPDPEHRAEAYRDEISREEVSRSEGQPFRIILVHEKEAQGGELAPVVQEYGVDVVSGAGDAPVLMKRNLAVTAREEWTDRKRPTVVIHAGDLDRAGISNYASFRKDVVAWGRAMGVPDDQLVVLRIGLLAEHVQEHVNRDLWTPAPTPHQGDGGKLQEWPPELGEYTAQWEAAPPAARADIVRGAVVGLIDEDLLRAAEDRDVEHQEAIAAALYGYLE